jgi:hypothetical protein
MIRLLPLGRVITAIAVVYASITGFILWLAYDDATNLTDAISIAFSGSTILNACLLGAFYLGWKKLWAKFPQLNTLLFPDLNGVWDMEIHWERDGKNGVSQARAFIKQDFLKLGMDVEAEDSDSETLIAVPKKDSETGRPLLYYVFLTTPKHRVDTENPEPYKGAAILKVGVDGKDLLRGNYFTSRKSAGHYELRRVNT